MYKNYIKRIIDIIVSTINLIVLSPLYLIIGITIKIIDKGPVFYTQNRTGKNGQIFKIYKFRTMRNGQITKLGKFLRNTSLDELPQFFNVLKGDMSIIGPRPWIPDYYDRFDERQKDRTLIRPGLVGLAQIKGRKDLDIFEKINYDIYYVENINFIYDIIVLIKSFRIIIRKENNNTGDEYIKKELDRLEKNKLTL